MEFAKLQCPKDPHKFGLEIARDQSSKQLASALAFQQSCCALDSLTFVGEPQQAFLDKSKLDFKDSLGCRA